MIHFLPAKIPLFVAGLVGSSAWLKLYKKLYNLVCYASEFSLGKVRKVFDLSLSEKGESGR